MAIDWEMPRRGAACLACQKAFKPDEVLRACLVEAPEGYQRRDYCLNCEPANVAGVVGSWKTRCPPAASKKTQVLDRAAIFELFAKLEDADTPERVQLRFVLALLLWRKKALKFIGAEAREELETWNFTTPKGDADYAVLRPDLGEDQLERLGEQLESLLTGEISNFDALIPRENAESTTRSEAEQNPHDNAESH